MKEAKATCGVAQEIVELSELTVEVAPLWPPRGRWTEADYFALPDTNQFIELSEGELVIPPHPTDTHQRVVGDLYVRLRNFERHHLGPVRLAPLPVRLWPGKIREPDILFVSKEHTDRIGEQVYGPPDLVVEVLSSGTRRTDRLEKPVEYAQAGVGEYWIVDPEGQMVEVFTLFPRKRRFAADWLAIYTTAPLNYWPPSL